MARRIYTLEPPEARVAYTIEYEKQLNEEQLAVVTATKGPLLVLAGAGTGKTRTLVYRVARLIESGVKADSILLLTFTNKAAKQMMSRVAALLGEIPKDMWGGTFHSVGNKILRRHATVLGYPNEFSILDTEDSQTLMSLAVAHAKIDVSERRFPRANVLCQLHSLAINTNQPFSQVIINQAPHYAEQLPQIEAVYAHYVAHKKRIGVMDYDDLLVRWLELFTEDQDIWRFYADRFEYVLVDEYQDTNHLQGRLVDRCAELHNNLMVVGDDCQSIYKFRGAEYSNILEFPKRHANTKIFRLQTNYRSSQQILDLSNASIRRNTRQFQKVLKSMQPDDEKPAVVHCRDAAQQAAFVAQRLLEIREEGVPLSEIAILYRAHYQSLELQVELSRRGIPFIVRSGIRFFEQAHIKDVVSFLKLVNNPNDELAFHRILKTGDGIGKALGDRIWRQLKTFDDPSEGWVADGISDGLPKRAKRSWDRLRRLLLSMQTQATEANPAQLIDQVLDDNYQSYLRRTYENFDNRTHDIVQLGNFAAQADSVDEFLADISLQSSIAAEDVVEGGDNEEYLVLSSVHQAKGLEFHAVFVIWMAEGRFPSARSEQEDGLDEERRLFYVAATRAKRELYLVYPITVRERERGLTLVRRSPFIEELDPELYDEWALSRG